MPKELQGSFVVTEISIDNTNFKFIVCEQNSTLNLGTTLNETKTKTCGTFTAVSNNSPTITGTGIVVGDIAPASQATFMDLVRLKEAGTSVYIRRQNAASGTLTAGELTYIHGIGRISELSETSETEGLVSYTFTLVFSGTYTVAIGS